MPNSNLPYRLSALIRHLSLATCVCVIALQAHAFAQDEDKASRPPNIIFIMADDLGYGDLGCYGQEKISTPVLDQMAKDGMRFRNFYAGCTVCAPARCVLMTGKHMGHAYVRGNGGADVQTLRPEDFTVAELLKTKNYSTGLCGKWGLGETTKSDPDNAGVPNKQGFDHFFGYQNQRHAHNYYPAYLWRNETRVPLRNKVVPLGKQEPDSYFEAGYSSERLDYSHDLVQEEAESFIRKNKDTPFFLYLSLTIPHANNEGTLGTKDGQEVPDYGQYKDQPWINQDKGQAAMITRMDQGIGRINDLLAELKIANDTIVMFTSDNGHHDEGGHNTETFDPNGPLRGKKRDLYEGGIRVPLIVTWPGKIKPGSITNHISYHGDLMATAAELSGAVVPDDLDSISFVPTLMGNGKQLKHDYLYWEFYEQGSKQAVRQGKWKAVRMPMMTGKTELYDLENDLGEATDLAGSHPEIVKKMEQYMEQAHTPNPNWKIRAKAPKSHPKPGDGRERF